MIYNQHKICKNIDIELVNNDIKRNTSPNLKYLANCFV